MTRDQRPYHAPTGLWSVDGATSGGPAPFRTSRYGMARQVERALNATKPVVMTEIDVGDTTRLVVDVEATAKEQAARENDKRHQRVVGAV